MKRRCPTNTTGNAPNTTESQLPRERFKEAIDERLLKRGEMLSEGIERVELVKEAAETLLELLIGLVRVRLEADEDSTIERLERRFFQVVRLCV